MTVLPVRDAPAQRRRSAVLFLSLALNLLLLGVLASQLWSPPRSNSMGHTTFVLEQLASTLPAGDAQFLREEWAAQGPAIAATEAAAHAARDGIRETLRAEPLDPGALDAAMARFRQARTAQHQALQAVLRAAILRMSADGRRTLADWSAHK
jgi:uncharacterized membrane protein